MDNRINNNVNFQGAFVIKSISAEAKSELLELIPKKRQLFNDFKKEGDILLVTRNSQNTTVADFIRKNHLKFRYYPPLCTKSGFDDEKPLEAAKKLAENKNSVITTLRDMYENLKPKVKLVIEKPVKIDRRNNMESVLKALKLDSSGIVTNKTNGYTTLSDKNGKVIARVSPKGKFGTYFVFVEPKNTDEDALRYAIDESGNIIAKYVSFKGLAQFKKNFMAAVNFNKKSMCN